MVSIKVFKQVFSVSGSPGCYVAVIRRAGKDHQTRLRGAGWAPPSPQPILIPAQG